MSRFDSNQECCFYRKWNFDWIFSRYMRSNIGTFAGRWTVLDKILRLKFSKPSWRKKNAHRFQKGSFDLRGVSMDWLRTMLLLWNRTGGIRITSSRGECQHHVRTRIRGCLSRKLPDHHLLLLQKTAQNKKELIKECLNHRFRWQSAPLARRECA